MWLPNNKYIATDTETEGLEARYDITKQLWCVGMYGDHPSIPNACTHWDSTLRDYLNQLLGEGFKFIFHEASFDVQVLRLRGVNIQPGQYIDTKCMSYCLFPSEQHGLEQCAAMWLNQHKLGKPKFDRLSEEMMVYCQQDTKLTYQLFKVLREELQQWEDAHDFFWTVELPYIERVIEMEKTGSTIDKFELDKGVKEATKIRDAKLAELYKVISRIPDTKANDKKRITGLGMPQFVEFNPNSAAHIQYALKQRGWKPTKQTKSGKDSVDKYVLQALADDGDEFASTLIEYNKWEKYLGTFLLGTQRRLDAENTDRLRTSIRQFRTATGRLSSSNPNLQNIPARGDTGSGIRSMFVAPEGYAILVGDLDRIELAVLGFYLESMLGYTELNDLIKIPGSDAHEINRVDWSAIIGRELERKPCKNGIFAQIYGCGVRKFAQTIGCRQNEAKEILSKNKLLKACAELREVLIDECIQNQGVINNFFGRNLYIPQLLSDDRAVYAAGTRKVFNYLVQSTAGDVFKIKQNEAVSVQIQYDLKLSLVVHDEAIYYCPEPREYVSCNVEEEKIEYYNIVCDALSNVFSDTELLKTEDTWTPVSCKFHHGKNWFEAKGD